MNIIDNISKGLETATQSSIEMSKSIADYGALVAMGGVMLIIILLLVGLFIYQLVINQKKMNTIPALIDEVKKDLAVLKDYLKDAAMRKVNLDQARALLGKELDLVKYSVIARIIEIKEQNNLDDTEGVKDKISLFLQSAQSGSISFLRKFEFSEKLLSEFIFVKEWVELVMCYMEKDCVTHELNYRLIENKYSLLFDRFKRLANERLDEEV